MNCPPKLRIYAELQIDAQLRDVKDPRMERALLEQVAIEADDGVASRTSSGTITVPM